MPYSLNTAFDSSRPYEPNMSRWKLSLAEARYLSADGRVLDILRLDTNDPDVGWYLGNHGWSELTDGMEYVERKHAVKAAINGDHHG